MTYLVIKNAAQIITPAHSSYNEYMDEKSGKVAINYNGSVHKQSSEEFLGDELPF